MKDTGKKRNLNKAPSGKNAGFLNKIITFPRRAGEFLREVRAELKKVTWPTSKEVVGTTIVVLILVVFFSIYLYIWDVIFAWIIEGIRRSFGG
ncbi:MAG: preprotein translocase subunit SecE [Candidatus Aminicenantes bacterium]|nr:preprotein translocase subunit SecE [Candidatus Aminicenantes bacterium]